MQDTCRIRAGYVQDTCRVRAGYVQDTCGYFIFREVPYAVVRLKTVCYNLFKCFKNKAEVENGCMAISVFFRQMSLRTVVTTLFL